jgi:hypothetical protein
MNGGISAKKDRTQGGVTTEELGTRFISGESKDFYN